MGILLLENTYYNRNDGKIIGPLKLTEKGNYWDIINEEIYNTEGECSTLNGTLKLESINTKYRKVFFQLKENNRYINRDFEITQKLKFENNEFIDERFGITHNKFGWNKDSLEKSDFDLILEVTNDNIKCINFIKELRESMNEYDTTDLSKLCECHVCSSFRDKFNGGFNFKLINEINRLKKECENYINLDFDLPDFYYINVSIQVNLFQFFSDLLELFDNDYSQTEETLSNYMEEYVTDNNEHKTPSRMFDSLLNNAYDFDEEENKKIVEELKDLSENEKETESKSYKSYDISKIKTKNKSFQYDYNEFLSIQRRFIEEKNLMINFSLKKFKKLNHEQILVIFDYLGNLFRTTLAAKSIQELKINPIINNLSYQEILENSFSEEDFNIDGVIILNPKYNYSLLIKNKKVVSIIPINKK